MEVKSRYSVVAELEAKKRGLMAERDGLEKNVFEKAKELDTKLFQYIHAIKNIQRKVKDLDLKKEKFLFELSNEKVDLERKIQDMDADKVRIENDGNRDIEYLKTNMKTMKDSLAGQINSVDENLKRFGMSVKTK